MALLIALLATALLTVTVLEFTYSSQVAYRRAAHWLEAERARLAAESGIALASEVLSFDGQLAKLVDSANLPAGTAALVQGLDPRLAKIDGALDLWAHCSEPGPWTCNDKIGSECTLPLSAADVTSESAISNDAEASDDDFFTVRIEDETGFYNLNRLAGGQSSLGSEWERLQRLFQLAGVEASLVGPVVDWIDKDTSPLAFPPGAEASQYAAQDREPLPRNGALVTFRELAMVMGMKAADLRAIRKVATALPIDAHASDAGRINVNTAPLPVLQSLSASLSENVLAELHAQRCTRPFLDEHDLVTRVPGIQPVKAFLTYQSSYFRVRSTAHVGDSVQSVEALLHRDGATIEPQYILAQRGANIETVDSPPTTRFELETPALGGPS